MYVAQLRKMDAMSYWCALHVTFLQLLCTWTGGVHRFTLLEPQILCEEHIGLTSCT